MTYARGELRVSGGLFGATPVALAIAPPAADPAEDPRAETARLAAFGKDVARRLAERKAADWLESTLSPR